MHGTVRFILDDDNFHECIRPNLKKKKNIYQCVINFKISCTLLHTQVNFNNLNTVINAPPDPNVHRLRDLSAHIDNASA